MYILIHVLTSILNCIEFRARKSNYIPQEIIGCNYLYMPLFISDILCYWKKPQQCFHIRRIPFAQSRETCSNFTKHTWVTVLISPNIHGWLYWKQRKLVRQKSENNCGLQYKKLCQCSFGLKNLTGIGRHPIKTADITIYEQSETLDNPF